MDIRKEGKTRMMTEIREKIGNLKEAEDLGQ